MATTATPGSAAPTAPERVARFGSSERALHWIHTAGFFAMFASGLVLYLPALASVVASRPLAKGVHLVAAVLWLTGLALVAVLGDRRALRATRREIEAFSPDDVAFLRAEVVPSGRFNGGQKAHTVLQAVFAVLFTVSGALLWLGERDNDLRLPGTILLHDTTMLVAGVLVLGHIVLATVWPTTRPSLRGMTRGDVDAAWARKHHRLWEPAEARSWPRPGTLRLLVASAVLGAGLTACVLLV